MTSKKTAPLNGLRINRSRSVGTKHERDSKTGALFATKIIGSNNSHRTWAILISLQLPLKTRKTD
jgi:hypothetical protein